ncbi:hypothetical protein [Streptomyces sp. NPDC018347]|uniref:hypothetical protein n=1 Tax=Streptomyces sp. NPDC018347 TaxID=3157193 RepID=UPI0033DF9201
MAHPAVPDAPDATLPDSAPTGSRSTRHASAPHTAPHTAPDADAPHPPSEAHPAERDAPDATLPTPPTDSAPTDGRVTSPYPLAVPGT